MASCAGVATSAWPRRGALAGSALPISFAELVHSSRHALVGTPVEATASWEQSPSGKRIVTYARVEVQHPLDGRPPSTAGVRVRTLGGAVGDIGQIVHGEAVLELHQPTVLFIQELARGVFCLTGMAQGHFPLRRADDDVHHLMPSPHLAGIVGSADSPPAGLQGAARLLTGLTIAETEALIAQELIRGL